MCANPGVEAEGWAQGEGEKQSPPKLLLLILLSETLTTSQDTTWLSRGCSRNSFGPFLISVAQSSQSGPADPSPSPYSNPTYLAPAP